MCLHAVAGQSADFTSGTWMKDFDDDQARYCIQIDSDAMLIQVEVGVPLEVVRASVYPHGLRSTSAQVSGTVSWEGVDAIASVVKAEVDSEPWARRLQLLWATVSPSTAPVEGKFDAERWVRMKASMPHTAMSSRMRAVVTLDRESWTATSGWSTGDEHDICMPVPTQLRTLDAGSLLVEMSSRLILNVGWL